MTLVVPFDGSELAEAALVRATEFAVVFDEPVLAVTVIPTDNAQYASERGWISSDEAFDLDSIVETLEEQVNSLSPEATFEHHVVDRYAPSGAIARRIRRLVRDEDASMVFIGSDNAGHVMASLSSVGDSIASDGGYDVVIVRQRRPTKIASLRRTSPHRESESDFYQTEGVTERPE